MAQSTRAQLEALRDSLIRSGGVGGKTSAEDLRTFQTAIIDSLLNILDDANLSEGYMAIDSNGRVDATKINSINSATIKQVLNSDGTWLNHHSGRATFSGTGAQTTFTVTHGGGFVPVTAVCSAGTADSARVFYTNNYTLTTFDVVFIVAPIAGASNVVINFTIQ